MGTASDIYARFGHAAIRIGDTIYNYGYTDFANPQLMVDFVRGRALFWGEVENYADAMVLYREADRTVVRQRLNLSASQLDRLQEQLARLQQRYVYNHVANNCATRLRDVLDASLEGAIRRSLKGQPPPLPEGLEQGFTLRALVRRGFAGRLDLLMATALFFGRSLDRQLDSWQSGFLPELLWRGLSGVEVDGKRLLGPPSVAYRRTRPPLAQGTEDKSAVQLLWGVCSGLLLLGLATVVLVRRRSRASGAIVLLFALLSTFLALPLWFFAAFSSVPELAQNEWALLFWPTDIVLFAFGTSLLRARFWRRRWIDRYLTLRLAGLAVFGAAQLMGLLYQRPLVLLVLASILLLSSAVAMRILPPSALVTSTPARSYSKEGGQA